MLRLLIRSLGLLLLAGGFAALIVDGTRSLAGGELHVLPLSESAADLFPQQMLAWRTTMERQFPHVWSPFLVTLLLAPLSLTLTGLGALLIAASRKRRRMIDYPLR
jgi:ABC-type Fe3+ transport system permease subunit